jgi:Tol biopolymer transport system component
VTPFAAEPGAYTGPFFSPDGSQLAVNVGDAAGAEAWIFDVVRGTRSRVGVQGSVTPSWTPDGNRITYSTANGIYSRSADGTGEPELILPVRAGTQFGSFWSSDGKSLVYYEMHPSTGRDIWMLPVDGEPVPLVVTEASERSPRLSPNGRWLAYVSDESGRDEIYVQAFPETGMKQIISTEGGREPVWSRDGTELFYRRGDELLVVDVDTGDELEAGTPKIVLTARFAVGGGGRNQNYDVSPDSERFVFVQRDEGVPREVRVVVNWLQELERVGSQ